MTPLDTIRRTPRRLIYCSGRRCARLGWAKPLRQHWDPSWPSGGLAQNTASHNPIKFHVEFPRRSRHRIGSLHPRSKVVREAVMNCGHTQRLILPASAPRLYWICWQPTQLASQSARIRRRWPPVQHPTVAFRQPFTNGIGYLIGPGTSSVQRTCFLWLVHLHIWQSPQCSCNEVALLTVSWRRQHSMLEGLFQGLLALSDTTATRLKRVVPEGVHATSRPRSRHGGRPVSKAQ